MNENPDEITKLLQKLKDAGAVVKSGGPKGKEISENLLDDLKGGATPAAFDAWVSWTKHF